jgi:hypothetical protein
MPRDNMAAEFVADLQCALEVEFCPFSPVLGGGHAERLGGGVDLEPGLAVLDAGADHGQANAVAGDRGAVGDGGLVIAAGDPHAVQLALCRWREVCDLADVGDNSGKH